MSKLFLETLPRKMAATHRHFKGGYYTLLGYVALESANDEEFVLYRSVETGKLWVRSRDSFDSSVFVGPHQLLVRRFEPIPQKMNGKTNPKSPGRRSGRKSQTRSHRQSG